MRKMIGGAVVAVALGLIGVGCQGELPSSISYDCPITNSGGDTISVGDTISLDCTRTAP